MRTVPETQHDTAAIAAPANANATTDTNASASWKRAFARVVGTQMVYGLGFSVLSIAPTMLVRNFHADAREVGVATATLAFGAVVLAPFAGVALDRFGRVPLIRAGALVSALAMVGFALGLHIPAARTLFLFLAGASFVLVFNGTSALVADIAPLAVLARAMGWQGAANMVAHAIAPTLAEYAAPHVGWRAVFLTAAGVMLVSAGLTMGLVDQRPKASRAGAFRLASMRASVVSLAPLLLVSICAGGVYGAIFSFQQPAMIEKGALAVRAYFFGFTAGALLMRIGFGSLADRVGHAKTTRISLVVYGLVSLAFVVVTPATLGLGGFAHGVAHGVLYPALIAMVLGGVAPESRGLASSLANGAFHGGHALASLGLGALAAALGTAWVFVAGAGIAWLAIPFARPLPARSQSAASELENAPLRDGE